MERLKFLFNEDVKSMHEATLQVLSEVGIIWTHKPSLDILTDAGCTVKGNRVYFPPDLVMKSIDSAGKRPCIRGRNGQVNELGAGNLYFHNLGGARDVFDARTGTRRIATEQDVIDSTRLLDALPNAHTVTPFFTPRDVPGELMSLFMYRHTLPHTTKPV
ncbi:MAG TPA: trimethylamine methyltransferase family protein, partial [Anaerolineales bacterium]|nr:trimethylamine methyltransferase family protein [Anaerolineales bacterium]